MREHFQNETDKAQYTEVLGIRVDAATELKAERWESNRVKEAEEMIMSMNKARLAEIRNNSYKKDPERNLLYLALPMSENLILAKGINEECEVEIPEWMSQRIKEAENRRKVLLFNMYTILTTPS